MHLTHPFWPRHAFLFKGGGGQVVQQIESAPVPIPAPAVTHSSAEVVQAEQDLAKDNLLKKSVKKTIFAGDTGGFGAAMKGPAAGGARGGPVSTNKG